MEIILRTLTEHQDCWEQWYKEKKEIRDFFRQVFVLIITDNSLWRCIYGYM